VPWLIAQAEANIAARREAEEEALLQQQRQEDPTFRAIHDIMAFIAGLRAREILTQQQARLLEEMLFESSQLLFAAYSVAVSANDSEYFAEICKDISKSRETEAGREICESQDEVLSKCDELYLAKHITESQLLYLRHLVLIRDEFIANIYDEYQETADENGFALALYNTANTHPKQSLISRQMQQQQLAQQEEDDYDDDEEEDDDEDEDEDEDDEDEEAYGSRVYPSQTANAAQLHSSLHASLNRVIAFMVKSGAVTGPEAVVLADMIKFENEYVVAAFELFQQNQDLSDLMDTLARCAKLEIRRKVADAQEERLQQRRREQALQDMYANAEEEDDDNEEEQEAYLQFKAAQARFDRRQQQLEDDDEDDEDEDEDDEVRNHRHTHTYTHTHNHTDTHTHTHRLLTKTTTKNTLNY